MGDFEQIKEKYDAILHSFDDEMEKNSMLSLLFVLDSKQLED
jgi:hypothetical protein